MAAEIRIFNPAMIRSRCGPPEEFGAWAARERQRWTRVVKQSSAKAE